MVGKIPYPGQEFMQEPGWTESLFIPMNLTIIA
jgi:hypothetical protein